MSLLSASAFTRGLVIIMILSQNAFSASFKAKDELKPKYGPIAQPRAVPLSLDHEYMGKNQAADYWAMAGFYVPQFNEAACSVASVSIILNAARVIKAKNSETKNVLQEPLLDQVKVQHWKERLSRTGYEGKHGMNLDALKDAVEASFKLNGFSNVKVTLRRTEKDDKKAIETFRSDLIKNEASAKDFIISNFNQKATTDDAEAGHISPIAAYDQKTKRVLVFDVDRTYYEPYWVSDEHLLEGMMMKDSETSKSRGYLIIEGLE